MSEFSFVMGDVPKVEGEGFQGGTNTFIRSKKDNTLFKDLQVENIEKLYTEDVIAHIDADSIAYKSASSIEDDFVEVVNNKENDTTKEGLFVPSGAIFKNKTEFKGAARTEGKITAGSYLDIVNVKREVEGLELYTLDDFEIVPKKKLKYEKGATIDGLEFKNSEEVLYYFMDNWIECIKKQTLVDNVKLYLGAGKVHRHFIQLPKRYKEARVDMERPLLLQEARDYLLENYPSELAPEGYEADERVDAAAFNDYLNYRKTGKISGIKCSIDKDNWNTAGFSFNYTKDFHFKYPQIIKIDSTDLSVGCLEWSGDELKGTGLLFTALQLCLEDSADGYGSRLFLPKEMKQGISYGSKTFYKDFINLDTPQKVLQKVVDKFAEWFPNGVRYTAWDGTEVDENTIDWLQKCFQCVYMTRKENDPTTIHHLLKRFKVDTSAIENNNLLTAPYEVFDRNNAETLISAYDNVIDLILNNNLKAYKSGKKQDLVDAMDSIKEMLLEQRKLSSEGKTKLVQKNKSTGEIVDYTEGE